MQNLLIAIFGKRYVIWAARQRMKANMWRLEQDIKYAVEAANGVHKEIEDQKSELNTYKTNQKEYKQIEAEIEGKKMVLEAIEGGNPYTKEPGLLQLQAAHGKIVSKLNRT